MVGTLLTASGAPDAVARPPRLALGPPALEERRSPVQVGPGLTWTRIVRGRSSRRGVGPWVVNVLRVDRGQLPGRLSAVLSNGRVAGTETTSSMARRTGAAAGVNGGFFVSRGLGGGDPVGALAVGESLVSESTDGRAALLLPRAAGTPARVASLRFRGRATVGTSSRALDGVDRVPGRIPACGGRGGDRPTQRPRHHLVCGDPSELVVLSPRFGPSTPGGPPRVELVVRGGQVVDRRVGVGTPIPSDGYVLSATGTAGRFLRAAGSPGAPASTSTQLLGGDTPVSLADHEAVVGGGPRLLRGGRVAVRGGPEGFTADRALRQGFTGGRNPRTLAGVTAGGGVLLVTVDGRRPGYSVGVTLREAARLMRSLGAREALNLDGGGSSTMVVRGKVVNRPSDPTGERRVGDGVFVLPPAG